MSQKLVVLIVLDGWGVAPAGEYNAITNAKTSNFDKLLKFYPSFLLTASGSGAGYAEGEVGDSERGHLILGAGRSLDKIKEQARPPTKDFGRGVKNSLPEVLSKAGLRQLFISETEKFIDITYFFNGFCNKPFVGADWINVPSPVTPFYKNNPEMSAKEVTKKILQSIAENKYNFIAANFANPDMVAHEGDAAATFKAIQITDECLGEILDIVLAKDGSLLFTSDHGNAENARPLLEGEIMKPHTPSLVPGIIAGAKYKKENIKPYASRGALADIAPTILKIFGIRKPREMTGKALI